MLNTDINSEPEQGPADDAEYEAWLREKSLQRSDLCEVLPRSDLGKNDLGDTNEIKPKRSLAWAKLLIVLVPLLFLVGYYSYDEVLAGLTRIYSGAAALPTLATTTINTTITPTNLRDGLVAHFSFDGARMDWSSTTAEVIESITAPTSTPFVCGQSVTFTYNGSSTTYGTVTGADGRCWMDRNLGANQVATGTTDSLAYGHLFQWGRSDDGHQVRTSGTTATNADIPGNNLFITETSSPFDWRVTPSNILWQNSTSTNNPCPATWRVPTQAEWGTWTTAAGVTNSATAYNSSLKLTLAGVRSRNGGGLAIVGTTGAYWANGISVSNSLHMIFDTVSSNPNVTSNRATGLSVRCIQDVVATTTPPIRGNLVDVSQNNVTMGKIGQGLSFNGSTSFVDLGSPTDLNLSDENRFTLSAWVYPTATPNGVGVISEMYSPSNTTVQYELGFDMDQAGTSSKLAVGFYDGVSWRTVKDSVNISLNQWVYITGTWDGTTLRLYKNGTQVNSSTPGGSLPSTNYDKVVIGKRHDVAGLTNFFPGRIDDVRVYNRALSAAEVAQLYELGGGSTIKICEEASVQDADGNTYNTLAIGSQCWLDRNMNVGTWIDKFSDQTNNSIIEKYCYNDSDANCNTNHPNKPDGGLYCWNEAMQYSTTSGARGICPAGFHIPTDAEWHTLEKFLTDDGSACSSTRVGAGCLSATTKLLPSGNSRFEANLAGYSNGFPANRDTFYYFWSSTLLSASRAWIRQAFLTQSEISRVDYNHIRAFSIRCIQD